VPPVEYDQIYLSSSIRKDINEFFAGLGASYSNTTFNKTKDNLGNLVDETYRNETDTHVVGRLGYKFSPALYSFVEPSGIWQQFGVSEYNTHGYRVVAGLGSERISLFSGEIFAGYQSQNFDRTGALAGDGPVFGARVSWSPTRDIMVSGIVERSIGVSGLASGLNGLNTGIGLDPTFQSNILNPLQQAVSTTTSVGLQASYAITRELSADAATGYQVIDSTGGRTDLLSAQVGLKYMLLRNLGLRLDYAYLNASAGEPLFTRNRVTVGVFGQL
jgi:hypothetical protein